MKRVIISYVVFFCTTVLLAQSDSSFFSRQPGNSIIGSQQYMHTNGQEYINPGTGGMTIVATDIVLPGRNGLDVKINRVYRSRHLVSTGSNTAGGTWYGHLDHLPQRSNMGSGWRCFMGIVELPFRDQNEGTLYLGDGSTVELYRYSDDLYYSRGSEKIRMIMTLPDQYATVKCPIVYMPDGKKYYFSSKNDDYIPGFRAGSKYNLTKIMDNNGNFIEIQYGGGTEIDHISDTWGRKIQFHWSGDQWDGNACPYPPFNKIRCKLDSITIQQAGSPIARTICYNYDLMNFGPGLHNLFDFFPDGRLVTVLKSVHSMDSRLAEYEYGAKSGGDDYYMFLTNLTNCPNADRGQLTKVKHPWGGEDRYYYKLVRNREGPWGIDDSIYSVIEKKGNADYTDLWQFDYEPNGVGLPSVDGFIHGGYWEQTRVTNARDSLKTVYVYGQTHNTFNNRKLPLLTQKIDSTFNNGQCAKTITSWGIVSLDNNKKSAPRISTSEQHSDGSLVGKQYYYYYGSEHADYDNVSSLVELGNGIYNRETKYTYLHLDNGTAAQYNNLTTWFMNRPTSKAVYENYSSSSMLLSLTRYRYDQGQVMQYNRLPLNHDNDHYHQAADHTPRGNLTNVIDSLGNSPRDSVMTTTTYDECGNPVLVVGGNGTDTIRNEYIPNSGQTKTVDSMYIPIDPDYLCQSYNNAYGLGMVQRYSILGTKLYAWTPQDDTTRYTYEPINLRLENVIRKGDNGASPSVHHTYFDYSSYYSMAYDPSRPPYTSVTVKQAPGANCYPTVQYYDKNGYVMRKLQGGTEIDYTRNATGLVITETNPHTSGQTNPPTTRYFYDGLRRVKQVILSDGSVETYRYGGLWKSRTDANGDMARFEFDRLGRLERVIDGKGQATVYEYNGLDKLTKITMPDTKVNRYYYNPVGWLVAKWDADTDSSTFRYDKAGNLVWYQDAKLRGEDKWLAHRYDRINRLVRTVALPDSQLLAGNTYDSYGFLTPGDLASVAPGESVKVYNTIQPAQGFEYFNQNPDDWDPVYNGAVHLVLQPSDTFPPGDWRHSSDFTMDASSGRNYGWSLVASLDSKPSQHCDFFISFPFFGSVAYHDYPDLSSPFASSVRQSQITSANLYLKRYSSSPDCEIKPYDSWPMKYPNTYGGNWVTTYDLGSNVIVPPFSVTNATQWAVCDLKTFFKAHSEYTSIFSTDDANDGFPTLRFKYMPSKHDTSGLMDYWCEFQSSDSIRINGSDRPYLVLDYISGDSECPVYERLRVSPGLNSCYVDVSWKNDWTVDTIYYGMSSVAENYYAKGDTAQTRTAVLGNLVPGGQYRLGIVSRDVTGNRSWFGEYSFRTDTLAFAAYGANQLRPYGARLSWQMNYPAGATVRYGASPDCAMQCAAVTGQNGAIYLNGLLPGRKYYFRIEASAAGRALSTPVHSFTTPGIMLFADSTGHLTRTVDQSGETVYGYDREGRLITRRSKHNATGKYYHQHYGYDRTGSMTFAMRPDGLYNFYRYDSYGRLDKVSDDLGDTLAAYTYTAAGACATETFGNRVCGAYTYNPRLWLQSADVRKGTGNTSNRFNHTYYYDPTGNLTTDKDRTDLLTSITRNYEYDGLNRLTQEYAGNMSPRSLAMAPAPGTYQTSALSLPDPGYSIGYQYDAMGNRTGGDYAYYPGTNRMQTGNGRQYGYDASGNLASDGVWSYQYNALGKLTRLSQSSGTTTTRNDYLYNAGGLRTSSIKTETVTSQVLPVDRTFAEAFDDLLESAPTGDGHDDARDMGSLSVRQNDNFLFFTIDHKYVYGAAQGDFQNLYIAIDTDNQFGSGSTWLPESTNTRVSADHAWEYCVYIHNENDFGLYTNHGFKLERPASGGKKMTVNMTPGANSKVIVKVPVELLNNSENISFVVVSVKPGARTYGVSQACDVAPGGRLAMEGSLITRVNEYNIVPRPGTTRTTVTGEGFVYDNAGNVICDLDKDGNIVRKYVYGPSTSLGINKHLAMQIPSTTQPWTYENNVLYGGWLNDPANVVVPVVSDPAALVDGLAFKCTKGVVPGWNCVVWGPHTPDQSAGGMYKVTFRLKISDNSIASPVLWLNGFYHYGTAGEYVILSETQVNGTQFTAANQYQEFEVMMNIPAGITNMEYRVWTHDMCDIWVDRIVVQNMSATTYYYHCDYLGSPRVMTDAAGAVTWRQDYYAFGSDYGAVSSGNTHKYTGHLQDNATGQYYAKARYFTTQLGRWSQPEPLLKGVPGKGFLVDPQKLNPYVYCANNPTKHVDPDGNWAVVAGIAALGVSVDYGFQWKASGKSFGEYYKSGQYTLGRGLVIGGATAATVASGGVIAGGQGTLAAKMIAFGATSSLIDIAKRLLLGQKPDNNSAKASAIVGATSAGTMALSAGANALADKISPASFVAQQPIVNSNGGTAGFENVAGFTPANSVVNEGIKVSAEAGSEIIQKVVEHKVDEEPKE